MDDGQGGAERSRWPSFHIPVLAMGVGALGTSVLFDVFSQRSNPQFVYAKGGWTLIGLGLLATVVGITLLVADVVGLDPGSTARRRSLLALCLFDVAFVWFGFSYLHRRPSSMVPVSLAAIAISTLVVTAALVALGIIVLVDARPRSAAPNSEPPPAITVP